MSVPSPLQLMRAMSAVGSLRETLLTEDSTIADDDKLLLDLLEGQTDVFELLDRVVESSMADGVLAELAAARAKRLKARQDHLRNVALRVIEALAIRGPIERPSYTASIAHRAKAIVTQPELLPSELLRTTPNMDAIKSALKMGDVDGAIMSNPQPVLTIRTR